MLLSLFQSLPIIQTLNFIMKKILLSSLAVFIVFLSHAQQGPQTQQAQIKKGTVFIGGSIGLNKQSPSSDYPNDFQKNTNIIFSPSVGWAIKDNLVFGVMLGVGYQKYSLVPPDSNYSKTQTYSAGVFLRKYKYLGSGFSLFGQGNFFFNYAKTTNYSGSLNNQTNSSYTVGLGFNPGVAYRINTHWQIETIFPNLGYVNYGHAKQSNVLLTPSLEQHSSANTLNIGSSLSGIYQFSVGVQYVI
jgi:hypothetical protein